MASPLSSLMVAFMAQIAMMMLGKEVAFSAKEIQGSCRVDGDIALCSGASSGGITNE